MNAYVLEVGIDSYAVDIAHEYVVIGPSVLAVVQNHFLAPKPRYLKSVKCIAQDVIVLSDTRQQFPVLGSHIK